MRFSRELMVSALSSGLCEYQAFELLPLSGGSLAWGNHPFVHELTSTQLTAGGVLSIESSCPYLGTLTSLGPLDSQLCLLNSGITICIVLPIVLKAIVSYIVCPFWRLLGGEGKSHPCHCILVSIMHLILFYTVVNIGRSFIYLFFLFLNTSSLYEHVTCHNFST
jgi:hypothetical protein